MDDRAFDRLTRRISASQTRRDAVRAVLGSLFGGAIFAADQDPEALAGRRKGKKNRRGKSRRGDARSQGKRGDRKGHGRRRGKGPTEDTSHTPEETGSSRTEAEISVEACLPPGQGCTKAGDCCSLKCAAGVCLCTENRQCPKPKSSCRQALCSRGRCRIVNRLVGSRCTDDGNPCTRDLCDDAGQCTHPPKAEGVECPGGTCREGRCCVPACADNKPCGDDGCGESCGTCSGNDQCRNGSCVCVPDCANKECGDDGCGGRCPPDCEGSTTVCSLEGRCVGCLTADDCPDPGPCKTKRCTGTTCDPEQKANGAPCTRQSGATGVCNNGECRECVVSGDCPPLQNGTVTCSQGFCIKQCNTNYHRVCGSNPAVCQECCNDNHCRAVDGGSTCTAQGQCSCPAGLTRCGLECIDLMREPRHCGTCTRVCPSGVCLNGQCTSQEFCGIRCGGRPIECDDVPCPGNKVCEGSRCTCPPGMVDCDNDKICESCGRCGVTSCPPTPSSQGGGPGSCCADGRCSCGGTCCASGSECFVEYRVDSEGTPIEGTDREVCKICTHCEGSCCEACNNGNCIHFQPPRGGSIRYR